MGDVKAFVTKWCAGHDSGTLGPKIRADLESILAAERAAATAAAVGAMCATCPTCRGTGQRTTSCSLCGDSTFDHECNDRDVPCERCAKIRALSPEGWVGVRRDTLADLRVLAEVVLRVRDEGGTRYSPTDDFVADLRAALEATR